MACAGPMWASRQKRCVGLSMRMALPLVAATALLPYIRWATIECSQRIKPSRVGLSVNSISSLMPPAVRAAIATPGSSPVMSQSTVTAHNSAMPRTLDH